MAKRSSEQFVYDYRPVIWVYGLFCLWQGWSWMSDPSTRFSAEAFAVMTRWAGHLGLTASSWGVPMVVASVFIIGGLVTKVWQLRWVGYFIATMTFLTLAEAFRESASLSPTASQTGVRTYVFIGTLPVVLAVVAQVHAAERRRRGRLET